MLLRKASCGGDAQRQHRCTEPPWAAVVHELRCQHTAPSTATQLSPSLLKAQRVQKAPTLKLKNFTRRFKPSQLEGWAAPHRDTSRRRLCCGAAGCRLWEGALPLVPAGRSRGSARRPPRRRNGRAAITPSPQPPEPAGSPTSFI